MASKLRKPAATTVDLEGAAGSTWPNSADGFELKFQIGQGAFAKVWQARCIPKDVDVAIKIIELDSLSSSLDDIYQEVRVMKLCKDPHVLGSYACFVVKRDLWLVMPLMRKGSCLRIMRYLKSCGLGEGLKEEWIAIILKAALEGLNYFHQQGQVHRDIKASNLLMDSDGSVMISDFGVAGWVKQPGDRTSERRTFVGTPCWMAPEVMEQADAYDEKADIWSLGITALELAKGYAPYARLNPMTVMIQTIREDPPSLKSYEDYNKTKGKFSRQFKEIITLCLQKNPKSRPSAATLLTKNFFKKAKPKATLVKELLSAVPIPDARDIGTAVPSTSNTQKGGTASAAAAAGTVVENMAADIEKATKGSSFIPGATWVFDDDEKGSRGSKSNIAPIDEDSFAAFEAQYAAYSIKDEEGQVSRPVVEAPAPDASAPVETETKTEQHPNPS
mmetsp:Transcript_6523/g.7939  ORF Transcript_6523/g.7939 Transcript_6523/m.7939 type:complete len:446 (+) Transcript_6523:314-1651(+)|eukprot:CAMPEP_0204835562 /NCGR_PEP_ID=MMETSP1346-20131115/22949_1 /ASSEMBLY_ACC=CAM_ASM_000771 /TAXON_ID=215587 /ORGANISM="Aplanochytrium stocchinoi, Strain GSBS06" /LENGTH=445 /DNA_ID=CAMNT_0051969673 /DNA_START=254 /DNA_END=1591 /DNA_ORIENTATION=+